MRFRERDVLTDFEWEVLRACVSRVVAVAADVDILHEGDEPSECRLVLEGWANVAEILRQTAGRGRADMIVLGAYGHSRLRERIFGGVTQSLLRHATLPLLLSH